MTFPTERHRVYKRLGLGRMADVFLLDERQYRTTGGDGQPRRLLGETQMAWLIDELQSSSARWKLIGQQVLMAAGIAGEDNDFGDAWNGYADDRTRLLQAVERAGIQNVVVLTGDAHAFMANHLNSDFEALGDGRARPSAVEYVGGSVTSLGREADEAAIQRQAPWNRQYDAARHGYAFLDVVGDVLTTEYRISDRTAPAQPTVGFQRFTQPSGTNEVARQQL
jgi:phosphodiesterase/alkaline phosphatase D-like protein